MKHAFGDAIQLSGFARARVLDVHNVVTEQAYVGAISLQILPPGATHYNEHSITSGSDGAWSYLLVPSEVGYINGTWRYRLVIPGGTPGAIFDHAFTVDNTFAQTTSPVIV